MLHNKNMSKLVLVPNNPNSNLNTEKNNKFKSLTTRPASNNNSLSPNHRSKTVKFSYYYGRVRSHILQSELFFHPI